MKLRHLLTFLYLIISPPLEALETAPRPEGREIVDNSTKITQKYKLWIPDGVPFIRGVIAISAHGPGNYIYEDFIRRGPLQGESLGYRDLAKRLGFALFLYPNTPKDERQTVEWEIENRFGHLTKLGKSAGHPELEHAGVFTIGLSKGGRFACDTANANPDRIIGVIPIAGSGDTDRLGGVPFLFMNQGRDGLYPGMKVNTYDVAISGRSRNHPWGWFINPNTEHHIIHQHDLVIVWIEEVAQLRLPEKIPSQGPVALRPIQLKKGYLVDVQWHDTDGKRPLVVDHTEIFPYDAFEGVPTKLLWFPSERAAQALIDYHANKGHLPDSYAE